MNAAPVCRKEQMYAKTAIERGKLPKGANIVIPEELVRGIIEKEIAIAFSKFAICVC